MSDITDCLRIEGRGPATLSEAVKALGFNETRHVIVLKLIVLGELKPIIRTAYDGSRKIMVDPVSLADYIDSHA